MSNISVPWHFAVEKIETRIEELREQLEGVPVEAVPGIQGQIVGLRYILNIPKMLPHTDQMIGDTEQE